MERSKVRIAITGATGLLGRNLLFEFIKQNIGDLSRLEILVLGRSKQDIDIDERLEDIVLKDGLSYIDGGSDQLSKIRSYYNTGIRCINLDLVLDDLGIIAEDYAYLNSNPIDIFFHIAAMTDFRNTPEVTSALERTNVVGTRQILRLISKIKVREFVYVGTAYSCGTRTGLIPPDCVNIDGNFRNPYELSKTRAELIVRDFASANKSIRFRYFRPSTISGRLIEPPIGSINKYDVFYAWASFFLRVKTKQIQDWSRCYEEPFKSDIRLYYSNKSGLNIVPADYAAKVMYQVCRQGAKGQSFHLVNSDETPHRIYIPIMLKAINFSGATHVDAMPTEPNRLEQLYYKTVGSVFTPYITSEPMLFDTSNLTSTLDAAGLKCPAVDSINFSRLIEYAKSNYFGAVRKNGVAAMSRA